MSEWVHVAHLEELTRGRKKVVTVGSEEIALFLVGDRVYALHNVCLHKQRSLAKGTVFNGRVVCPGHQWAFDLETGWEEEKEECQPTYEVKVEGDSVHVIPQRRVLTEAPAVRD
ncbi:nitrite reductase (NADH) small subunit [Halopolyspora algeriensis]|uniref:Nitrite reductase (NADH) small subunit n=1 Tax=Halopolyspora algeriensis TaxID=1500506 RepID=A0A368VVH2_9ACTN|nr:Rieske 2Fe-2S domain-containing protein [Halopolyspora algeriensis]RCW45839.1 nitrite reductase (NADH) small subunit [Halopolyspora algeriensis]TQM55254.1 nitrite reductase (NADH) small subunit [Halopolyspora algeriensis]